MATPKSAMNLAYLQFYVMGSHEIDFGDISHVKLGFIPLYGSNFDFDPSFASCAQDGILFYIIIFLQQML